MDRRCVAVAAPAPAAPAKEEKKKKRSSNGSGAGHAPVEMRPGDERVVAQGDALGRPQHVDFTKEGDEGHDRTQEELDLVFHRADGNILRCVNDALGDAPLETGRIEVGLRIEASGQVSRVRVEAPQILQRRGVYPCIKTVASALRFGQAGGASVVTWPFDLK
jgi:hypothetical protein